MQETKGRASIFPGSPAQDATDQLILSSARFRWSKRTLGELGVVTRVEGPDAFPAVVLRQPFEPSNLTGMEAGTVRVFRVEPSRRRPATFWPVWDSGINVAGRFVWSRIDRPGLYAPIGLPRDRLLFETLRALARARCYRDPQSIEESRALATEIFRQLLTAEEQEIDDLRVILTHLEIATSPDVFLRGEVLLGRDAVPLPFPLPGDMSFQTLRDRIGLLENPPSGLPEEKLFFPPEKLNDAEQPWLILPDRPLPRPVPTQPCPGEPLPTPWPAQPSALVEERVCIEEQRLKRLEPFFPQQLSTGTLGWLFSRNWWMHHRDPEHTGCARASAIRSTNVSTLVQRSKICLCGPIVSMPCIVAGKIYVGTSTLPGAIGGTLYKIDLATGLIEASFSFEGKGDWRSPHAGVASTPAVSGGKVFFSALTGRVYCLHAVSLACLWVTDLRHRDLRTQNQPVDHGDARANGWSSPLVVNDRVYVACGEGEETTFGFVYCLEAATGKVIWLFCTNQFTDREENKPNIIPPLSWRLPEAPPKPFKLASSNPFKGASPWSAAAYSEALNRIYIGTGNADPDDPLPDPRYASGLLALDATTGDYKGFFQPRSEDSYRPDIDHDVDVPAGPLVFSRGGTQYVAFGSKNGSFFILDADSLKLAEVAPGRPARRQLLPYHVNGQPIDTVDPPKDTKHENKSGVFGTAALAAHLSRFFICLGGYGKNAMDHTTTPFIRALDWQTLDDAWALQPTDPPRYYAKPPLYTTAKEAGLSSPAVVNDVVFVSTTKPALYAFDAGTGNWLWEAPGIPIKDGSYALGPAIYGDYVVNGVALGLDGILFIYSLR